MMTSDQFRDWMSRHDLSNRQAADLLGMSRNTVNRYANGTARIPRVVDLATRAITAWLASTP